MSRYDRNILIGEIGVSGQKKISKTKLLVCGAGGLGSIIIQNAVSLGIEEIGIVDYDVVEQTNLNRQVIHKVKNISKPKCESAKEWIIEYNPSVMTKIYQTKFDQSNFEKILMPYDIVADCFDSFESKFFLNKACNKMNKPLIHMGVEGFCGQVMTILPNKSACLNCVLEEKKIEPFKGIIAPVVSVIGSLGAMEILNYILYPLNLHTNIVLRYEAKGNIFKKTSIRKNLNCKVCK